MKVALMWAIWFTLVATEVQTLVGNAMCYGNFQPIVLAVFASVLLCILYYAEGLELAVADLRDKDPAQISDTRLRKTLVEIQENAEFFFSQRQIFVAAIITFVSLTLNYDALYFWPFGWVRSSIAKFVFGLAFNTTTILWFCQVAPKRLAIINSERFLRQALLIWPLVKLISHLGLVSPVEMIVKVARRMFGFEHERRLGLSLDKLYTQEFEHLGVASDTLHVEAHIKNDGDVMLRKRHVLLFGHGQKEQFGGIIQPGFSGRSRIKSMVVKPLYLGCIGVGEDLKKIYQHLDNLSAMKFDGSSTGAAIPENLFARVPYEPTIDLDEAGVGDPGSWSIRVGMALPEGLTKSSAGEQLVVMVFEVEAVCSPGVFALTGSDYWKESFNLPCRRYVLEVTADPSTAVVPVLRRTRVGLGDFASPFPSEEARVDRSFMPDLEKNLKVIDFPTRGAVYQTTIDFLHVEHLFEAKSLEHFVIDGAENKHQQLATD